MSVTTHRWNLAHEPSAAGTARRHVGAMCRGLDRDLYETALLLTSELVTSALQVRADHIELTVSTNGQRLHVEVRDDAAGEPPRLLGSAGLATRGRGLMLVQRLATAWGVDHSTTASGKSVWFELRLPGTAAEPKSRDEPRAETLLERRDGHWTAP